MLGEPLPKDQSVISLLDLKGPFFHDLLPEKWTTFQKSLSSMETGISLLWPTRKSQMHCTDPRYGSVHGVARSAQIELSIELATLELDSFDQQALDAVLKFMSILRLSADDKTLTLIWNTSPWTTPFT